MPFSAGMPHHPAPRAPTISHIRLHLSLQNPRFRIRATRRRTRPELRTGERASLSARATSHASCRLWAYTATRLAASTRRRLPPRFPSARPRHGRGRDDPSISAPANSPHLERSSHFPYLPLHPPRRRRLKNALLQLGGVGAAGHCSGGPRAAVVGALIFWVFESTGFFLYEQEIRDPFYQMIPSKEHNMTPQLEGCFFHILWNP